MIKAIVIVIQLGFGPGLFAEAGIGYSNLAQFDTVDPVLTLASPIGGELWYIGEDYSIQWTASDTNFALNSAFLWYSIDGGDLFNLIAEYLPMGGSYSWQVPPNPSVTAVVRVKASDTFGNSGQAQNATFFELRYMKLKPPDNLAITIVDGTDALITWDPVTETVNEVPLPADSYQIFYSWSPEGFFFYLDTVSGTSSTHANIAALFPSFFYYVVAYADNDSKTAAILQQIQGQPGAEPLTLQRFRELLNGKGGN